MAVSPEDREMEKLPLTIQDIEDEANSGSSSSSASATTPQSTSQTQVASSPQRTSPTLPPPAASVEEVRDYLRELLITKHSFTPERTEEIAVTWGIGRGWTLRALSLENFNKHFGDRIGTHIYLAVHYAKEDEIFVNKLAKMEAWKNSTKSRDYRYATIVSLVAATIVLIVCQKLNYALIIVALPQIFLVVTLPTERLQKWAICLIVCLLFLALMATIIQ